jgi:hypothetical protein
VAVRRTKGFILFISIIIGDINTPFGEITSFQEPTRAVTQRSKVDIRFLNYRD